MLGRGILWDSPVGLLLVPAGREWDNTMGESQGDGRHSI